MWMTSILYNVGCIFRKVILLSIYYFFVSSSIFGNVTINFTHFDMVVNLFNPLAT